ncbi:uncharacterized protein LOC125495579 [Beta vulgaris subsp. vulgaris]|uniref:uncharacterized protein LOC125495579 n=1 Tax=Beta vulgaris subsp. vulgaris TaxID=3555 RepID=UPI002036C731|nr:uncharacterized protein LOC125495579 [Beta vulgaris subsp. vulgaris]
MDDALSRALQRKDRPRRVLTVGRSIGITFVWGDPDRSNTARKGRGMDDEEMKALEARVSQRVREQTMEDMNSKINALVRFMAFVAHLADVSGPIIVAEGTIHPRQESSAHSTIVVRVSVDDFYADYADAPVPLPTSFITKLSQAEASVIEWPKELVFLVSDNLESEEEEEDEEEEQQGSSSKEERSNPFSSEEEASGASSSSPIDNSDGDEGDDEEKEEEEKQEEAPPADPLAHQWEEEEDEDDDEPPAKKSRVHDSGSKSKGDYGNNDSDADSDAYKPPSQKP